MYNFKDLKVICRRGSPSVVSRARGQRGRAAPDEVGHEAVEDLKRLEKKGEKTSKKTSKDFNSL